MNTVITERHDKVLLVRLNRPEALNALDPQTQIELSDALNHVHTNPEIRVAIISGEGQKAFCVGADLGSMQAPPAGQSLGEQTSEIMLRLSNQLIEDLRALPFPVVSAINGPCAGAGRGSRGAPP